MSANVTAKQFIEKLRSAAKVVKTFQTPHAPKERREYFRSEDDQFLSVHMGKVFALAKEFMDMLPEQIEKLLESWIHEVRVGAVSIDWQARNKKTPEKRR